MERRARDVRPNRLICIRLERLLSPDDTFGSFSSISHPFFARNVYTATSEGTPVDSRTWAPPSEMRARRSLRSLFMRIVNENAPFLSFLPLATFIFIAFVSFDLFARRNTSDGECEWDRVLWESRESGARRRNHRNII